MERYYGEFGGQYVSESLMNTLKELEKAFEEARKDPQFWKEYHYYMKGKPSLFSRTFNRKVWAKDLFKKGRFKPYWRT